MTEKRKKGLGRGLDALLPSEDFNVSGTAVRKEEIKINAIAPNPFQPRTEFDEEMLSELADSIKAHGIIQPLLLRKKKDGYELIAGERRLRAAGMAGLSSVPAVVREIDDRQAAEIAIVENIQRQDLNPLEEAAALDRLCREHGLSQDEAGRKVGKSRVYVANSLRLLNLPEEVRALIALNRLTAGHGRALLFLKEEALLKETAEKAVRESLSVRQLEDLCRRVAKRKKPVADGKAEEEKELRQILLEDIRNQLTERLSTKVNVEMKGKKGIISIEYYSLGDLQRILDSIIK